MHELVPGQALQHFALHLSVVHLQVGLLHTPLLHGQRGLTVRVLLLQHLSLLLLECHLGFLQDRRRRLPVITQLSFLSCRDAFYAWIRSFQCERWPSRLFARFSATALDLVDFAFEPPTERFRLCPSGMLEGVILPLDGSEGIFVLVQIDLAFHRRRVFVLLSLAVDHFCLHSEPGKAAGSTIAGGREQILRLVAQA